MPFFLPSTDIRKVDPDWARSHQMTMWAAGYSRRQVRKHIAQPGFAAQRAAKKAKDEAEAAAKEAEAHAAKNAKASDKKDNSKPASDSKDNSKAAANDKKTESKPLADKKKADVKFASDDKKDSSGKPDFTFAEDEDKKLLELKENGQSWKAIAQEMKKPQSEIKKRYYELAKEELKGADKKGADKKGADKKKDNGGHQCKDCGCHAAKDNKAKDSKADKSDSKPNVGPDVEADVRTVSDVDNDKVDYVILYPNEECDEEDCKIIARAIYADIDNFYLRIASRVYDHSGMRVSPGSIQRLTQDGKKKVAISYAHLNTTS